MAVDNPLILQEEKKAFNADTALIAENAEGFAREIAPYFFSDTDLTAIPLEKDSAALLERVKFFRIESCTVENADSFFEYLNERIKKLLSVVYAMNVPVCFGVIGHERKTSIVLGIEPDGDSAVNVDSAQRILRGLMPDISISEYRYKKTEKNHFGIIGGVPSYAIDGEQQTFDYSPMLRALNGEDYTFLVFARPCTSEMIREKINALTQIKDTCLAISKRNVSLQRSIAKTEGVTETDGTTDTTTHGMNVSVYGGVNMDGVMAGGGIGYNFSKSKSISKSISQMVSDTITNGESLGIEIQNGFAIDIAKRIENAVIRLQKGLSTGFWQTAISFSAGKETAIKIMRGCLYSEIAKSDPTALPPRLIDCDSVDENQALVIPKDMLKMDSDGFSSKLCAFANTEEMSLLFALPDKNAPGYELKTGIRYPVSPKPNEKPGVELGAVCDGGNKLENIPFSLSFDDLNKHTFVCGITGSGKTNTVKHIIAKAEKPFWIIECAKKEYRKLDLDNPPVIYTPGLPEINSFSFNPFYIMRGVSPQMHIDFLKDLFNASFSFYGPMPYILEKCLHTIYEKKGWNLSMGYHPYLVNTESAVKRFDSAYIEKRYQRDDHKLVFPTMYDLKNEVEEHVKAMGYHEELESNIKTAILARLESLCVGAKGFMLNTGEPPDFSFLLNNNIVFELEGLADDSDKAFVTGILIIYLTEWRMCEKETSTDYQTSLRHLLVIEEAHRLLKNISTEKTGDEGNPKGKAVEHFTNIIAEMRSYGQGVIIAEQIPAKIAPDVIKNASNKIIHRIVARDDQELLANMIGMDSKDALYLGDQITGRALCHTEGMRLPISVAVPKVSSVDRKDGDLRRKTSELGDQDFSILKSLLRPCLYEIEDDILKLLHSFLTLDMGMIKYSIPEIKKIADSKVKEAAPNLRWENKYNEAAATVISERLLKYLFSGVYYTVEPPDCLLDTIRESILYPSNSKKIDELRMAFVELDDNNDRVINAVAELAFNKNIHHGKNFDKDRLIKSYFIKVDYDTATKIKRRIEKLEEQLNERI